VGPGPLLQELGIGVVVDAPGVGQDLQDHLACGVVVQSQGVTTLARADSLWSVLRYALTRRGPLTSNVAEACGFHRTRPDLPAPDLEVIFAPAGFADHGFQRIPGNPLTVGAVLLQPLSRGAVNASGPDAATDPTIEPNYLSDAEGQDLEVLVEGMMLARRILSQEPLARHVAGAIAPAEDELGDEALADFIRTRAHTLYHPVGTCRMGSDPASVVTPELTVRGVEGLRVADASIMPRIIRGHPHWPVIMIAEKASDLILSDR
jgi:choline dehydrogenase